MSKSYSKFDRFINPHDGSRRRKRTQAHKAKNKYIRKSKHKKDYLEEDKQ